MTLLVDTFSVAVLAGRPTYFLVLEIDANEAVDFFLVTDFAERPAFFLVLAVDAKEANDGFSVTVFAGRPTYFFVVTAGDSLGDFKDLLDGFLLTEALSACCCGDCVLCSCVSAENTEPIVVSLTSGGKALREVEQGRALVCCDYSRLLVGSGGAW